MAKFRVRSKNSKKGIRWAKGQSSSSNPAKTKHRDNAKSRSLSSRYGIANSNNKESSGSGNHGAPWSGGPAKLTAESLLKHDVLLGDTKDWMVDNETETLAQTHKTFETFASDWTQCTNMSFNRIMKRFDAFNPQHKEILAILAAVTEVIKSKGGEESSTEYFSALLTTLEAVDTIEGLSATLTLLGLVIKTVPQEVLQNKFGVSKLLLDNLVQHGNSGKDDSSSVVRSLVGCLSVMLRAQSEEKWHQSSTMQVYRAILSFCTHPKPKIRKVAQHAVCSVLKGSFVMINEDENEKAPDFHPAAAKTAEYCLGNLNIREEPLTVLHTFLLLKEIIGCFQETHIKAIGSASLSLIQSNLHPHMNICGMQMFYGLFNSRPSVKTLGPEVNARMISAMYDFKPSVNDPQAIISWLTVQQEALINLANLEPKLCLAHLPNFFMEAKKCWTSDKQEVRNAATVAMKAVLNECVQLIVAKELNKSDDEKLRKVVEHVQEGLGFQYHGAWPQVLQTIAVVFEVLGSSRPDMLLKFLPILDERRNAQNFAFTNELDYVIGKAIRKLGPRMVLDVLDLQITGTETSYDFPRSWLLPVLRENIQNTELKFFVDYFKPLAERCKSRSLKCKQDDDNIGFKTYEILEFQMWSLLPGFCNHPMDLRSSFKLLAKCMGDMLVSRKELRLDILASLRQLISKNLDNEENRGELAKFAKNFLPLLCNIYIVKPNGSEESGQRLAVFETIKLYAQIAPQDRLTVLFDTAFDRYLNETDFVKESTLDIVRAYFPYQDVERIQKLFDQMIVQITSSDHKEQKKAYKVLEAMCSSESSSCKEFLNQVLDTQKSDNLQNALLKSLSKASPSSQASRIRCLECIVRQLSGQEEAHLTFVNQIIPETILCIKAVNEKARSGAYNLLVVIGESLLKWREDQDEALVEFVSVMSAGLAGTPALMHCTLLAITRIFFEFRDIVPDTLIDNLVNNVCKLLTCSNREVVGACLSFLRVFVAVTSVLQSGKHLAFIVSSVITTEGDCQRHFRLKIRYLLDRIIRKFGYDTVSSIALKCKVENQAIVIKRLKNIKKEQMRKQRKKESQENNNEDSDDEEDFNKFKVNHKPKTMDEILAETDSELDEMDDDAEESKKKQNKKVKNSSKKVKSFIAEGNEGIIDFLDPSAAQMVTSIKPKTSQEALQAEKKQKDRNGGFKLNSQGKLIIEDSSSDDEDGNDADIMKGDNEIDSDNEEGDFKTLVSTSANRKRKHEGSVASSRRSLAAPSSMRYQAGGSGIHRPLRKEYGSEYRATKARGDVKRAGKPDPFAYVPLNKSSLNKRKRAKNEGQFNNLVNAAKLGAKAGMKSKGRHLAKRMKSMNI